MIFSHLLYQLSYRSVFMAELTGIEPDIQQANSGFLKVGLPENLDDKTDEQVQLLVRAMIVSLKTIEQDYEEYIKITFTA